MFIKKKFEPKKVSFNLDRTCKFGDDFRLSFDNYIFCCQYSLHAPCLMFLALSVQKNVPCPAWLL